jgi:uncharacterized membrane protein
MSFQHLWDAHPHVRSSGDLTLGERAADMVRNGMGSWRFIWIQTAVVVLWIALNLVAFAFQWDPYPFILLNLAFSTQAAYASPIILLSQRRGDSKASELAISTHENGQQILALNKQQMEILQSQSQILEALHAVQKAVTDSTAGDS